MDLKAAAKISANKKADLIPMKELLPVTGYIRWRSEEHTSELQSRPHLVCRLLLEQKNSMNTTFIIYIHTLYWFSPKT